MSCSQDIDLPENLTGRPRWDWFRDDTIRTTAWIAGLSGIALNDRTNLHFMRFAEHLTSANTAMLNLLHRATVAGPCTPAKRAQIHVMAAHSGTERVGSRLERSAMESSMLRILAGLLLMLMTSVPAAARSHTHIFLGFRFGPPAYYYGPPYYYYPPPVYYYAPPPVYYAPPAQVVQPYCRQFHGDATIDASGRPFYGVACLQADGRWHIVE